MDPVPEASVDLSLRIIIRRLSLEATYSSQINLSVVVITAYGLVELFTSCFMHWELFTPMRGRTGIDMLPTIRDVSRIQVMMTSFKRQDGTCQLRIFRMILNLSCTMSVTQ